MAAVSFPTGTPIPLTLCRDSKTGGCAPIVVSAPGYADLVISTYWPAP